MVTISVRIPDRLYREAKRIAAESGMSFGEVVRRGMEQMVRLFPEGRQRSADWRPPRPRGRGKPFARVIPEPAVSSFFGAGANTITLAAAFVYAPWERSITVYGSGWSG